MKCLATIQETNLVCGADTGGSFEVCAACTQQLHNMMQRTLRHYGEHSLADELDAHFRRYHAAETRYRACPHCFGYPRYRKGSAQTARPTCTL